MLLVLFFLSVIIGVSIGMLGMGGVFLTPVLLLLLDLPISTAMGTALFTFIGTGLLGTYIYQREGNVDWSAAILLGMMSVLGAVLGSNINFALSQEVLQLALSIFLAAIGVFALLREHFTLLQRGLLVKPVNFRGRLLFSLLGVKVGLISGLLGVGGPVLLVPILVALGWPMLLSVGVSQVVSVFSAVSGATSYLLQGRVELMIAIIALSGELMGVFCGGFVAHRIEGRKLKIILGLALIGLSIYLL